MMPALASFEGRLPVSSESSDPIRDPLVLLKASPPRGGYVCRCVIGGSRPEVGSFKEELEGSGEPSVLGRRSCARTAQQAAGGRCTPAQGDLYFYRQREPRKQAGKVTCFCPFPSQLPKATLAKKCKSILGQVVHAARSCRVGLQ